MSNADAWKIIMSGKPKYGPSWRPPAQPNTRSAAWLAPEDVVQWSSPYSGNNRLLRPKNNKEVVLTTTEPLTDAQHNRLLNQLKNVTAI